MAIKACNDIAGPDGLVPTLLVFSSYPRITKKDTLAPEIIEIQRLKTERQVKNTLNTRNGPDTFRTKALPIGSSKGPYNLLSTKGETCTIQMKRGPRDFRSTNVKPFQTRNYLVIKLRKEGIIIILGGPFKVLRVFKFESYDPDKHRGKIFNLRLVDKVKRKTFAIPYEKSRLVVQLPTIQRGFEIFVRDITQAYISGDSRLKREILMEILSYDLYLFITTDPDEKGIVGLQTDDTLILCDKKFKAREQQQLKVAKYEAKEIEILSDITPLTFNGCTIKLKRERLRLNPSDDEVKVLNKRIRWQMDNLDRGISSQLGYVMIFGNETPGSLSYEDNSFILKKNLLHAFSTKSKKVTRSVLVSEIYGMVSGVDIVIAVNNSFLLYECFVKLGIIKEKRREIAEIRWINREDNLADAIIKMLPNPSLKTFLDENQVIVRVQGWVKRQGK
ncbi:hypothetical protein DL98DRAFT_619938 [Cadophora sp. DSE1049]|nr:hypothetical protein DL98DRAFT_619938 [Cadophora sp. DSE1049]